MSRFLSGIFFLLGILIIISGCQALSEKNPVMPDVSSSQGIIIDDPVTDPTDTPTEIQTELPENNPTYPAIPNTGDQYGQISIQSVPSGANVLFDGEDRGFTPTDILVLTTGSPFHQIFLSMDGYQDWSTSITENPGEGETIPINANLVPYGPTGTPTIIPTPTVTPTDIPTPVPTPTVIGEDNGWFSIDTEPSGAELTFDGIFRGTTPAIVQVYSTGTPSHQILLKMAGFYDYVGSLSQNPEAGETIPISINLEPKIQFGSIHVTSSPIRCIAIIDGGNQDLTPCSFDNLAPGMHSIKIMKEGYQPYSSQVTVNAGSVTSFQAQLQPVVTTGTIYVTSTPSGADILLDNTYIGQTPYVISAPAGNHNIVLKSAGYRVWNSGVTVFAGEQSQLSEALVPLGPDSGSAKIASIPGGAAVTLNNYYYGLTPASGYLDIPGLVPGIYAISVTHPQNQDYSGTITITAGGVSTVNIALPGSVKPASVNGTLSISSHPSGAIILLDNLYKGVTPTQFSSIQPGTYTLTLRMDNYTDAIRPVTITSGATVEEMIDMIPVSTPTPVTTEIPQPIPTQIPLSLFSLVIALIITTFICWFSGKAPR